MKILCLHGYGTSADILKGQMTMLMNVLDDTVEFVFLDGEMECPKAPGVGTFVEGPFLCYSANFTPREMSEAHELINETIEDQGPFDGVLGFSQGGSLTLSYLLQHEIDNPGIPPPFKFAILFSSVVAFSADEEFAASIIDSLSETELTALSHFPDVEWTQLGRNPRALCETLAEAVGSAKRGGFIDAATDEGYFARRDHHSVIPRVMHPALVTERIRIPTVHCTGKKDSPLLVKLSVLMRELCDKRNMKVIEHSAGHDIPKRPDDAKVAAAAIEWAREQFNYCKL